MTDDRVDKFKRISHQWSLVPVLSVLLTARARVFNQADNIEQYTPISQIEQASVSRSNHNKLISRASTVRQGRREVGHGVIHVCI